MNTEFVQDPGYAYQKLRLDERHLVVDESVGPVPNVRKFELSELSECPEVVKRILWQRAAGPLVIAVVLFGGAMLVDRSRLGSLGSLSFVGASVFVAACLYAMTLLKKTPVTVIRTKAGTVAVEIIGAGRRRLAGGEFVQELRKRIARSQEDVS